MQYNGVHFFIYANTKLKLNTLLNAPYANWRLSLMIHPFILHMFNSWLLTHVKINALCGCHIPKLYIIIMYPSFLTDKKKVMFDVILWQNLNFLVNYHFKNHQEGKKALEHTIRGVVLALHVHYWGLQIPGETAIDFRLHRCHRYTCYPNDAGMFAKVAELSTLPKQALEVFILNFHCQSISTS